MKYVPHVICEGSREHVIWWDAKGRHCSEPRCVVNRPERLDDDEEDA